MKCPRDGTQLEPEKKHGMDIEHCLECHGRWLDLNELGALEALAAPDENDRRGMVEYAKHQSELPCPKCGKPMIAFNYRANPLELDTCDEHGYWLDSGESDKVQDYIEQRVRDLYRAASAEESWKGFLAGLRNRKKS